MVCLSDQVMVGYCFGDRRVGEVVLLALLPAWEARGIGRLLLQGVIDTLYRDGLERAGLDCRSDPGSLSCAGYRHLGWRSTGDLDAAQDELLDYVPRRTLATCPPDIH